MIGLVAIFGISIELLTVFLIVSISSFIYWNCVSVECIRGNCNKQIFFSENLLKVLQRRKKMMIFMHHLENIKFLTNNQLLLK